MQADFERELSKRIGIRRLIVGCLVLVFLALFMAGWILTEATREIKVYGGPAPIPTWERAEYQDVYVIPIVIGIMGALLCGSMLLADFLMCGHRTIRKDLHCITLYRGPVSNIVYIDGQEKGRLECFASCNVVEVCLPEQVRVTVSFSRSISYMAHISFSDDTASREV